MLGYWLQGCCKVEMPHEEGGQLAWWNILKGQAGLEMRSR